MKINCDFYNQSKDYNLTSVEKEIVEIIKKNNRNEYHKVIQGDARLEIILALSELRENILNWYPFKENSNILEIGANFGEITGLLCEKATKVVSIENSLEKAQAIAKRFEEYDNLEVIAGDLDDININDRFDYITLTGSLELYKTNEKAKNKLKMILNDIAQYLKKDGKILIAVDNKFAMKYITSLEENSTILTNDYKALSKKDIINILNETGFKFNKFYYPLPDYKLSNVIFTDNYLPNQENITRNFTYLDREFISYNQTEAYKEILKEDTEKFDFFANSYFIEASKYCFEDNRIKFISFTNIRKEKYRIKTIMYDDKVIKKALNSESKTHINQIKKNIECLVSCGFYTLDRPGTDSIISKYVCNAKTYDQILIENLKKKNIDEFISLLKSYRNELLNKLKKGNVKNNIFDKYGVEYDKEKINELNYVKHGLWDIIFQNIFYIDNEMYIFDQEWYDENVPIDFIIYRALLYFKELPMYISREEVYKYIGIDKYIELFKKLDDKIQLHMRDDYMWNLHISSKNGQMLLNLANDLNQKLEKEKEINEQKTKKIIELEKQIDEHIKNYEALKSSTSWKVTKPLRFLGKHIKIK